MPVRKIPLEKDSYYHIFNRWFEKRKIFKDRYDFDRFMKTIVKYKKDYSWIKIFSYCFLPNHFHFIITSSKSGLEISDFMRKIQQAYTMYFRAKYLNLSPDLVTRWPFFEWRFKAKLIDDEKYLYQCMTYVAYNAQKHEIVKDIADYPYTSYHQMMGLKPKGIISFYDRDYNINDFVGMELDELEF